MPYQFRNENTVIHPVLPVLMFSKSLCDQFLVLETRTVIAVPGKKRKKNVSIH